ncbi:MAG TPA: pentapeptide repeat-containing protein, partial [Polyangiaceae bacterium]|nr:pentapeptide repeat-containing protein [Polyangiaceae bacterium]
MITIHCETRNDIVVATDSLAGADLTNLDLHRALLGAQSLTRSNLSGSNLRSATPEWSDLTEANLSHAKLAALKIPRFRGHPNKRKNAHGVIHGQTKEAAQGETKVHARVQGGGSAPLR